MDLAELVGLRPVPCAGLVLMLTQRCPLHCAHCSTASTMTGEQADPAQLLRLVRSFGPADRPELLLLTGGEPLLRPGLVVELAAAARERGVRTAVLSGLFFARNGRFPAPFRAAARAVDHFSASVDREHEREVPRAEVFRVLAALLDEGKRVSLHVTGHGEDDPYLAELTTAVRRAFGRRVPMLVNEVRALGRAASWTGPARLAGADRPGGANGGADAPAPVLPCAMAAWPVVAPDGAVLACGNQDTVDLRPVPEHLLLGHAGQDSWQTLRGRALGSPELRLVRALGPLHLRERFGTPGGTAPSPDGPCTACRALSAPENAELLGRARDFGSGPAGELLDRHAASVQRQAGAAALVRRFGCARYAGLVGSEAA